MQQDFHITELTQVAQKILDSTNEKIFLFYGAMGAGKTTLIKELVKQLGVIESASSPTFSLVNEYLPEKPNFKGNFNNKPIYHFDFYRINNENEAFDIGFDEYIESGNYCFIEWAEKIKNLLPLNVVSIYLEPINQEKRRIKIIHSL